MANHSGPSSSSLSCEGDECAVSTTVRSSTSPARRMIQTRPSALRRLRKLRPGRCANHARSPSASASPTGGISTASGGSRRPGALATFDASCAGRGDPVSGRALLHTQSPPASAPTHAPEPGCLGTPSLQGEVRCPRAGATLGVCDRDHLARALTGGSLDVVSQVKPSIPDRTAEQDISRAGAGGSVPFQRALAEVEEEGRLATSQQPIFWIVHVITVMSGRRTAPSDGTMGQMPRG